MNKKQWYALCWISFTASLGVMWYYFHYIFPATSLWALDNEAVYIVHSIRSTLFMIFSISLLIIGMASGLLGSLSAKK